MSAEDKAKNTAGQAAGKVKEGAGKVTGNESLKAEGRGDQARAIMQAFRRVKDAFSKQVTHRIPGSRRVTRLRPRHPAPPARLSRIGTPSYPPETRGATHVYQLRSNRGRRGHRACRLGPAQALNQLTGSGPARKGTGDGLREPVPL